MTDDSGLPTIEDLRACRTKAQCLDLIARVREAWIAYRFLFDRLNLEGTDDA